MLQKKETEPAGKGILKKMLPLVWVGFMILLAIQYTQLDTSKKRFIIHLLKQVPYLPGRYYA
jgi:hypothetical protein